MSSGNQSSPPRTGWRVLGTYTLTGLVSVGGMLLLHVFTWQGFAAALTPWADAPSLSWPLGTRIAWWVIFYAAGISAVMRMIWREGRLECPTYVDLWLAAHVSVAQRLGRRTKWWTNGVKVALEQAKAHRPVAVPSGVSTVSIDVQDTRQQESHAA